MDTRLAGLGKIWKETEREREREKKNSRRGCWGGKCEGDLLLSKAGCAGASVGSNFKSASYTRKHFLEELPMSPLFFYPNFLKIQKIWNVSASLCRELRRVLVLLLVTPLNPCTSLAVLDGEIPRHGVHNYDFCMSISVTASRALSFCCSDTPYAAYREKFHRFKQFSVIDVFQARCAPISCYNICPFWLNSLISIIEDYLLDCTGSPALSLRDYF